MKNLYELRNILANYSLLLNVSLDNSINALEDIEVGICDIASPTKIIEGHFVGGDTIRSRFDKLRVALKDIIDDMDKQIEKNELQQKV